MSTPRELYWANVLTGGTDYALDKIDGADLADLYGNISILADTSYLHVLDDDNAGAEASPSIIAPDTNPGDKRWVHIGMTFPNTGLKVLDTNVSNDITIIWNEDDVADRIINFLVNGGDRTLDMNGNLTVESNSIVNQDLTTDAAPTFVELILTPSAAALSAVQGGIFYNSGDDHIYVCTEGA